MGDLVGARRDALYAASHTWECQVHEGLELLQRLLLPIAPDLGPQGVAAAKLALEVLRAAQALELTLHHDGQSGAQGLAFLHAGERGWRPDTEPGNTIPVLRVKGSCRREGVNAQIRLFLIPVPRVWPTRQSLGSS